MEWSQKQTGGVAVQHSWMTWTGEVGGTQSPEMPRGESGDALMTWRGRWGHARDRRRVMGQGKGKLRKPLRQSPIWLCSIHNSCAFINRCG